MQKNASKEPVTSKPIQQQQPDPAAASSSRRLSIEAAAGPSRRSSIQSAMESDIRQPRLHQHRLSLGQIPQEDFSGTYTRGSTQQVSHSRSSSGNVQSTSASGSPVSYGGTQGRTTIQRESTGGGGSDSNSSSGGAPQGSDQKAMESERGRLNQLMTNFFLKFCLVIVRSRMDVPPVFARGTATRKVNKWFNVELEETDVFREDLRPWKYAEAYENRPPPLIIETYIDAEELTPNQTLVILDDNERRHNVETTLLAFRNWRRGNPLNSKKEVVLERWRVDLSPPIGESGPELAVVYKKSIVLFRSLYSYARLLPSWKLQKKLAKGNKSNLRICCRVVNGDTTPIPQPDPLEIALIPRETNVTNSFQFGAVDSPAGTFTVKVDYRRQCEFRVDDSEALLSSHFLNLDEHYFKPSLHQRAPSQPVNLPSREPGSLPSHNLNLVQRGDPSLAYGSLTSFHQVSGGVSQSPISALRNLHISGGSSAGSPSEVASIAARSAHGSKASLRSESGVQRRPSVSFMQPFKNPPVSASPSPAEQYGHSPRTSLTRMSQVGVAVPARQRPTTGTMSPSSLKSSIPAEAPTSNPATPGVRYSSSFGNRRPRHSSGASKTEDDNNSSGRGSLASSAAAPGSGFVEASAVNSGISEEDRSLTDFMNMLDQKQPLKIFDSFSESSGRRAVAALGKYQKMRDSNAALQDSMSSSLLLPQQPTSNPSSVGRTQPGGPPALSGNSVSTSSSPGKAVSPHTPAIPSRLQQNETIVHEQTENPSSLDERLAQISPPTFNYLRRPTESDPAPSAQTTSTTATTSPMNIPSSPRFVQVRRSNSVSQEQTEEDGAGRFQSLRQMIGPVERPTSIDNLDRSPPFILADDSLTTRAPGLATGESGALRQTTAATSLSGSSPGNRVGASRTASSDRAPASAFQGRRPYRSSVTPRPPVDGRTPSENRGMFPSDDDLLFDFSEGDVVQRRSLDRSRGNSHGGDSRGGRGN
ncbi:autophagy protein 13 [Orbilia oligospora]|uniref:Autophagy-related protein 13 n=1 Tax=Orbilia oligospora TaxID=2813651 RepID=A0A7C8J5K9_ORBOL|nr:autophagy protein 13 [Orbilia oligospora]KAF3103682.1 autophagy protein 13 [Orbilia oligospora]KAF3172861.1 autophagy protein 13 [Orbilia oligospora]KAF3186887.1 autophagy protein 13 [Orbilia oligospora]KAF3244882.1 autophagy protein 13 [Orbilia oligospora]